MCIDSDAGFLSSTVGLSHMFRRPPDPSAPVEAYLEAVWRLFGVSCCTELSGYMEPLGKQRTSTSAWWCSLSRWEPRIDTGLRASWPLGLKSRNCLTYLWAAIYMLVGSRSWVPPLQVQEPPTSMLSRLRKCT